MDISNSERLEPHWDHENMNTDFDELTKLVRYEKDAEKSVANIIFSNPDNLNAIPVAGLELVGEYIKDAEADDDVKVIVLKGEGPCFGTGADADELGHYIGYTDEPTDRPSQRQRMLPDRNVVFGAFEETIADCLKATVCQVHGYCYGAHMQAALASDLIIASPDAKFTHPAFRYLGPAPQNMYMWLENLGLKKMKEIMLTMRPLHADEAEECGFVNKVVPRDELDSWVDDYVEAISMMPLDSLMMGKAMMQMIMKERGADIGNMTGWVGHGWSTNLVFDENDWNFLKERQRKGLTQALKERDEMVAPYFRMGSARDEGE